MRHLFFVFLVLSIVSVSFGQCSSCQLQFRSTPNYQSQGGPRFRTPLRSWLFGNRAYPTPLRNLGRYWFQRRQQYAYQHQPVQPMPYMAQPRMVQPQPVIPMPQMPAVKMRMEYQAEGWMRFYPATTTAQKPLNQPDFGDITPQVVAEWAETVGIVVDSKERWIREYTQWCKETETPIDPPKGIENLPHWQGQIENKGNVIIISPAPVTDPAVRAKLKLTKSEKEYWAKVEAHNEKAALFEQRGVALGISKKERNKISEREDPTVQD